MSDWGTNWGVDPNLEQKIDDEWDKAFPKPAVPAAQLQAGDNYIKQITDVYGTEVNPVAIGVNEYTNKTPTHDPYTNPGAYVYYQCECGAILDPHTKSFASLNNAAMNAGWKIRWRDDGQGYQPFCVECGKGIE